MVKKMLSLAMLLMTVLCLNAQQPGQQGTPLPLNPDVKSGVLPNGLHYYVLHNEEPKDRANFYIAQKVGSTLETPEQLGLAHFLEHMAFNGTTHYPGKSMLNYLQAKGIRFGADINAYTDFDETVYNIDNVPTTDKPLMDSVLLVIRDWSDGILLEESEINAERGVIEGEWRQRNTGGFRMWENVLPKMYAEYQYQQMPIGKMEIVRNFPPQVIRDYYKKWYRPDQQGIVIVGDFDAAEMEKKVIALFSDIKMPENAAERTYPNVSDNDKPIYVTYSDPETSYPMVMLSFKDEKTPFEQRNTVEYYVQEQLALNIFSMMINNRLNEYAQKPECAYAYAGVDFGNFAISKTKAAFNVTVIAKDDVEKAFKDAMAIIARACKTGFTNSELSRSRDELLASYEKAYNERDKTKNASLAKGIIRHFIDNEPEPGIELEYQLANQVLPALPVQAFNMLGSELLTDKNQVMLVAVPEVEGKSVPAEQTMIGALQEAIGAQYEAYVDEVITDPLISKLAKPGKIKSSKENAKFGTTELVLSNGAKVVLKPTDFGKDQIILNAFRNGGRDTYAESQAPNLMFVSEAFDASKLGNFNANTLQKYLAGKQVALGFGINHYTTAFNGNSTVKDLPTLMELLYAGFTAVAPDAETYESTKQNLATSFTSQERDPQNIFFKRVNKDTYGNNPLVSTPDLKSLNAASYPEMVKLIQNATANAADYTFIFTGGFDIATIKPLIEKYIASLPSKGKASAVKAINEMKPVAGIVNDEFKQEMKAPKTFVYDVMSGTNLPYTIENSVKLDIFSSVLDNKFTETLREEMGGTYGAQSGASINPNTGIWNLIYFFITNANQQDALIDRAYVEFSKLLKEGTNEVEFQKVKEAELKQYEINVRNNGYWSNNLYQLCRGWDMITNHKSAIENLTLADFNAFLKNLYNGKNRIQVVMEGIEPANK